MEDLKYYQNLYQLIHSIIKKHFLSWASLVSGIPKIWIKQVSTNCKANRTTIGAFEKICLDNKLITINNILSKHIYSSLVSNITEDPTGWLVGWLNYGAPTFVIWHHSLIQY